MSNTKVAILGANGRMGRELILACEQSPEAELVAAKVRAGSSCEGMPANTLVGGQGTSVSLSADMDKSAQQIDVVIDFTLPDAFEQNLDWCLTHKKALVVGTTGLTDAHKQQLESASNQIPILQAANFSVGVNLMLNLVRQAASIMGQSADIEILEAHHRHKVDAPSGTALAIGEAIADELNWSLDETAVYAREGHTGERQQKQIGFATVRAGDIVGEHTALFADIGERIEITHKASSRQTFASGAIRAAIWLKEQPAGLYDMQQMLGLS